jgi:hypothetical protein
MRRLAISMLLFAGCGEPSAAPARPQEARWVAVPGMETCEVERLEGPTDAFANGWTSCGEGCRTRPAVPAGLAGYHAERGASAAQQIDGRLYMRTSLSGPGHRHEIVERVDADRPELVLRMAKDCRVTSHKSDAALLVEAFRDPREHIVAVYSPKSGELVVHPDPIAVRLPHTGWFSSPTGEWGLADAAGIQRFDGEVLAAVATSRDWLLGVRAQGDRLAWIDASRQPRTIVQRSGELVASSGDVAAFGWSGSDLAWLEVDGQNTLAGFYDAARLRWPEGELDLSGVVASKVELRVDAREVGLSTPGDGAGIPPTFVRVSRADGRFTIAHPPEGHAWDLAGAASGRWLLQEIALDEPQFFTAWVER